MSDIKVVAFESDMKKLENLIKKRTGSTEDLSFPDGFVAEIPKIKDYLEEYLIGQLTEYTFRGKIIPRHFFYKNNTIEILECPNVEKIATDVFLFATRLKSIDLPMVTSLPAYTFQGCSDLQIVNIPRMSTIPDYCFTGCSSLSNFDFSNVTSLGGSAFASCTSLSSVDLTSTTDYGNYVFDGCSNLNKAILSKHTTSIPNGMFYGCTNLTSIDFTNIKKIMGSAFRNCSSLNTVVLPTITTIESSAFRQCTSLTSVVIMHTGQVCGLSSTNAFVDTPIASGEGFIYVPDALVEDYKAETNWSTYADQIKPISEYTEE